MEFRAFANADSVATAAAKFVAEAARAAVADTGRFIFAVSGGRTPWHMLRALVREDMPWWQSTLVQVDERIAPEGDDDRNLTHIRGILPEAPILPMPVNDPNVELAAEKYAVQLGEVAGKPPILDLVHLGLGSDGHTASLVPGDPVIAVNDRDVAISKEYSGRHRMTLTFPVINRAKQIIWLVTGAEKAHMLKMLRVGDESIPAGRVRRDHSIVFHDREAGC